MNRISHATIFLMLAVGGALSQTYTVKDLGALRGGSAVPHAINNLGHVVGRSGAPHGSESRAFLWASSIRDLGTFSKGDYSVAFDINDSDQVVGYSNADTTVKAF